MTSLGHSKTHTFKPRNLKDVQNTQSAIMSFVSDVQLYGVTDPLFFIWHCQRSLMIKDVPICPWIGRAPALLILGLLGSHFLMCSRNINEFWINFEAIFVFISSCHVIVLQNSKWMLVNYIYCNDGCGATMYLLNWILTCGHCGKYPVEIAPPPPPTPSAPVLRWSTPPWSKSEHPPHIKWIND